MTTLAMATALVVAGCAVALVVWRSPESPSPVASAPSCGTVLHVVTATSFAPVLAALAPALATGVDCAQLEITVADGRVAAGRVASTGADVWIPDDSGWAGVADGPKLAEPNVGGSGTVIATSPIYFVTDRATAERVTAAGGSWLGLAGLVTGDTGVRMVVRDPAGSGDGLVAAGAVGEAVWVTSGMNASAEALASAVPATRTVQGTATALPAEDGEVGLVPEYVLLGEAAGAARGHTVLAPTDHTALLRFTWLPTAHAAADPTMARAMDRVLRTLVGSDAAGPLTAAGLRGPQHDPPAVAAVGGGPLPPVTAAPFDVLAPHHVEHVFATWYAMDRRSDLLVVVDVSGSMARPARGSSTPLIDLVRQGCNRLGELLPDDAVLSLWEFGSLLDPPRDHRELLPRALMTAEHRKAFGRAIEALAPRQTGSGLHDTVLAAYTSAKAAYRPGTPNHVVIFTDGRNGDDPGSITLEQLTRELVAVHDPQRPVQLTIITFGPGTDAQALAQALKPVGGYVDAISTADEVSAAFIHVAAGGLHR